METIQITFEIKTDTPEATKRAVAKYLKETLEEQFLEPGESVESITIK